MKMSKHVRVKHETDPTSNLTESADSDEDPFRRLPEEISISIFNKVADLKCLFQCSLVSKHFASLITHVRTVSLTISCTGRTYSMKFYKAIGQLLGELYCCSSEKIPSLLDSFALKNMKLPNFMQKLRELEFIYLNYESPENSGIPFPMFKVKFSSNNNKLERVLAVMPRYIHNETEYESSKVQYTPDREAETKRIFWWSTYFEGRYIEWMCHLIILVKCHTSLQRVTLTDSELNAKLVIGDGQLVNTVLCMIKGMVNLASYSVAIIHMPVLRLPVSGYVLQGATLVIYSAPEDPLLSSENIDEITDRDFEDKLMVLREVVKEIFKNHRHKILSTQLRCLIIEVPSMQ